MSTPSWDDVEVGDEIVVETRARVKRVSKSGVIMAGEYHAFHASYEGDTLKSVEKPVQEFKPGDVVRWKGDKTEIYTLGDERYFAHFDCHWHSFTDDFRIDDFNSRQYELVED